MGTSAAKAFGDVLLVNKTIQHLNVSDNSFGKLMEGDQVKLKSSGEMVTVIRCYDGFVDGMADGMVRRVTSNPNNGLAPSEFEWESQVPAFCAGLAASTSLLSVCAFRTPCTTDSVC